MKKVSKNTKVVTKTDYSIGRISISDVEKEKIRNNESILKERYGIRKADVLRRLLCDHLADGKILFLMGFAPKKLK